MDRRHGKRPLRSDEAEEEEEKEDDIFPIYSTRSQQDMSAMVLALTQVIGNADKNPPLHGFDNHPSTTTTTTTPYHQPSQPHPQLLQDQGTS